MTVCPLLVSRSAGSAMPVISSADLRALVHFESVSIDLLLFSEYSLSRCWLKVSFLQAAASLDNQEVGFAPPSPKKVVTQATQRRKTADEHAREERFYQDLARPNTFAALADDSVSHMGEELSQEPLAEVDNREEPGQDSVASSRNRLVPLSCLNAAYPAAYSGEST